MWESKTAEVVYASIRELERVQAQQRNRGYDRRGQYYLGGEGLSSELVQNTKEENPDFTERKRRFVSMNYVGPLADQIINSLYGPEVERRVENCTEAVAQAFTDLWEKNNIHRRMLENASNFVPLGDSYVKAYYRESDQTVRYAVLRPQDVTVMSQPDDYEQEQMLVESRLEPTFENGKVGTRQRYFVWTPEEFGELHVVGNSAYYPDGGEMQPNIYGCIPVVHFKARSVPGQYYGLSMIDDAITVQKEINNQLSALTTLTTMQAFSILVIKGNRVDSLNVSEKNVLYIGKDGDATYLQPNAPIAEVRLNIEFLIERLFETAGVPISAIRSGSANSGVQLAIEFKPLADIVKRLKTQSKESEQEVFDATCAVLRAHGTAVPDGVQFVCDFPESFLPSDNAQEKALDLSLLNNVPPLMSREEFWQKWNPDITPEQMAKRAAEIDAGMAKSRQVRGSLFPRPGFTLPPIEGKEEGEE